MIYVVDLCQLSHAYLSAVVITPTSALHTISLPRNQYEYGIETPAITCVINKLIKT